MATMIPPMKEMVPGDGRRSDDRMTEFQALKLRDLSEQLGEPFDAVLTRRQAAARIRELERKLR